MLLDTYLKRDGSLKLTELSALVGVTKGRLSQLRHESEWPPEIALKVEEATKGAIDAGQLSPIVAKARMSRAA